MVAIGSMILLLLLSLLLLFGFCRPRWANFRMRMKWQIRLLGVLHLVLLLLLAYFAWPLLPAGQAQRGEAVELFLSLLSEGETQTAVNMIVPAPEEEFSIIRKALMLPENRPVSWDVTEPNGVNNVFGTVTFADGQTLDLFLGMEWEWEKARWGIVMLEFGRDMSSSKVRFWLYETFLPYSWARATVIYLAISCILLTAWQVWRLRKTWASLQEKSTLSNKAHNI